MTTATLFDLTPTTEQQMTHDVPERFARNEIAPATRPADETGQGLGIVRAALDMTYDLLRQHGMSLHY